MSEPQQPSPQQPQLQQRSLWRRLASPQKYPGYLAAAVGLGWRALDWGGRLDVLWQSIRALGGDAAMITSWAANPWFSFLLVIGGMAYVIFVGEPVVRTTHSQVVIAIGWVIAGLSAVVICSILLFGYFISTSKLGDLLASYEAGKIERHVTIYERERLAHEFSIISTEIPEFHVGSISDPEAIQYAKEFMEIMRVNGLKLPSYELEKESFPWIGYVDNPSTKGLMIGVKDKNALPQSAILMYSAFWRSGFVLDVVNHNNVVGEFSFFVGAK